MATTSTHLNLPTLSTSQHTTISTALKCESTSWYEQLQGRVLTQLSDQQLLELCEAANACYRAGHPFITNADYDHVLLSQLQQRLPEHPFLHSVEPEAVAISKTVPLPQRMLSTDKAYSFDEIKRWSERLLKAATTLGVDAAEIELRVTPKLDGYAAFDDGTHLYTRGDGYRGQDISRAFERGLQVANQAQRGLGAGEIVTSPDYFERFLSEKFENPRNIQAAVIAEKNIDPLIQTTIDDGACVFYPFAELPAWSGSIPQMLADFDTIVDRIATSVDYDVDGVIFETTHADLKAAMGATRKFHRWQIAYKTNQDSAEVKVLAVTAQTSRTGRLTPVAELEPTKLSGATLSRATAHHYGMVKSKGIGVGAVVELVRSGLVIPKIERVIKAAVPVFPECCPSCDTPVAWDGDHLQCVNSVGCPAQTENSLIHFFKTLGIVDGFGPKVIEKIHAHGVKSIAEIYALDVTRLQAMGFGEKTAQNLLQQLQNSRRLELDDWRFLAAFGITRMGLGNCERLLKHCPLTDIFSLSVDDLVQIEGFATVSAEAVVAGLALVKAAFFDVYELGFNLNITPIGNDQQVDSVIAGLTLVFTGKMLQGSRSEMEQQAKQLGAKVAKSVSAKTDYLVAGENVGASKLQAATAKQVKVITEAEYLTMIKGPADV